MRLLAGGLRIIVYVTFALGMIVAVLAALSALGGGRVGGMGHFGGAGPVMIIAAVVAGFFMMALLLGTIALLFMMHDRLEEIAALLRDGRTRQGVIAHTGGADLKPGERLVDD